MQANNELTVSIHSNLWVPGHFPRGGRAGLWHNLFHYHFQHVCTCNSIAQRQPGSPSVPTGEPGERGDISHLFDGGDPPSKGVGGRGRASVDAAEFLPLLLFRTTVCWMGHEFESLRYKCMRMGLYSMNTIPPIPWNGYYLTEHGSTGM